jgi:hypothetical protein
MVFTREVYRVGLGSVTDLEPKIGLGEFLGEVNRRSLDGFATGLGLRCRSYPMKDQWRFQALLPDALNFISILAHCADKGNTSRADRELENVIS